MLTGNMPLATEIAEADAAYKPAALLREGLEHQAAGELQAAAVCYQRALATDSGNTEALLLLGIAAREQGAFAKAIRCLSRAVALQPACARYRLNLGMAFAGAGSAADAERCYRIALELEPGAAQPLCRLAELALARQDTEAAHALYADARALDPQCWKLYLHAARLLYRRQQPRQAAELLERALTGFPHCAELHSMAGAIACTLGRHAEAVRSCKRALLLQPHAAVHHATLGDALAGKGNVVLAALHYERALALHPNDAGTLHRLGAALFRLGRYADAVRSYQRSLQIRPEPARVWHDLGRAQAELHQIKEAVLSLGEAILRAPKSVQYRNTLGCILLYQRPRDAEACFRSALALQPESGVAHANLGIAMKLLHRPAEMRRHYERALELTPECAGIRYNLGLADLRDGRYREGWERHEARWAFDELKLTRRHTGTPLWQGEPLAGRAILLHAEQGLGDTLQFARYAPLVAARGGRVLLELPACLVKLLRCLPGVEVITRGEALPPFDLQCPLMSLPRAFGTTVDTIPAPDAYLSVAAADTAAARARFPGGGLRVGLVWAGNPRFRTDASRSASLQRLLPLAGIAGVSLFSLQKGAGSEQLAGLERGAGITDAGASFADFYDTAAFMRTLDLVITVDTSCAHLAGALGVPVWIMLPRLGDWRWLADRETSPWYPTARLFRQTETGGWSEVVRRIGNALAQWNARRAA